MKQILDTESYRHPAQGLEQLPQQMTLRDWVAGMALQGMLSLPDACGSHEDFAEWAYKYADAMLKERKGS